MSMQTSSPADRRPTTLDRRQGVLGAARIVRLLARVIGSILTPTFLYLSLNDPELNHVAHSFTGTVLTKLSLALYFTSWVVGLSFDIGDQELLLQEAPGWVDVKVASPLAAVLLGVSFGWMCVSIGNERMLIAALALFVAINFVGWLYLTRVALPKPIAASFADYTSKPEDFIATEELELAWTTYQRGTWQWWRWAVALAFVGLLGLFTFAFQPKQELFIAGDKPVRYGVAFSAALLLFVAVFEGWIWMMRLQLRAGFGELDRLAEKYMFTLKSAPSPSPGEERGNPRPMDVN